MHIVLGGAVVGRLLFAFLSFSAVAAFAATDVYVAKDGDDANDGLTRATAKATIPAGYAVLTNGTPDVTYGNRLVIGDGEWNIDSTVVISNGWTVTSENGAASTTLVPSKAVSFFSMGSNDSTISNLTIDFKGMDYNTVGSGLVANNSKGTIAGCKVRNYYTHWGNSLVRINASGVNLKIKDCDFTYCRVCYRTAVFWIEKGTADFENCSFIRCHGYAQSGKRYFCYGMIYCTKASTFRNCLFQSCSAGGRYGSGAPTGRGCVLGFADKAGGVVENCSFIDCVIYESDGAALDCYSSSGTGGKAYNCFAYGCTSNSIVSANFGNGITYSNCASDAVPNGTDNVALTDENFTYQCAAEGRYMIATGPTIDAGVIRDWMDDALDLRGKARVNGVAPDIGCYEYHTPNVYYVAKDGDDANDGLTRATAKATIPAGYSLLSDVDEKLVIGEGVWTSDEIGASLSISNGWSLVGESGRTVFKKASVDYAGFYTLDSAGASVSGITIAPYEPRTYYVAKDGDDANDGLARTTAKATIPAAFAAMTNGAPNFTYGNTLAIGDGEWTSEDIGSTLVLSNGWSLVGENGRDHVVFKASAADFVFFRQNATDSTVRGITFDYNRSKLTYGTWALTNPKGTVADCAFQNYLGGSTKGSAAMIMFGHGDVSCSPVVTNCLFTNIQNYYNGGSVFFGNQYAKNIVIRDCTFVDCVSGSSNVNRSGGGTISLYRSTGDVRNCLFLRCASYGADMSSFGSNCSLVCCGTTSGNLTVENCSFVDCRIYRNTEAGAVGLCGSKARLVVRNCLVYGCQNEEGAIGFRTNVTDGATLTFSHCASVIEDLPGDGNIVVGAGDIKFRRPSKGDYSVKRGPTIDAGETLSWHSGAKDLFGRDRVIGGAPDIGAFEYDFDESGAVILLR